MAWFSALLCFGAVLLKLSTTAALENVSLGILLASDMKSKESSAVIWSHVKLAVCDVNMDPDVLHGVELRLQPTLIKLTPFNIVAAMDTINNDGKEEKVVGVLAPSTTSLGNSAPAKLLAQMCSAMAMPCIDFASAHATVPLNQRAQHYYARTNVHDNSVGTAAVSVLTQLLAATGHDDVALLYSRPLGGQDAADAFGYEAAQAGLRIRKSIEVKLNINNENGGEGEGDEGGGEEREGKGMEAPAAAQAHMHHIPAYDPHQLARQLGAIKQSGCKTVVLILPEPDTHAAATAAAGGGRSQLYTAANRLAMLGSEWLWVSVGAEVNGSPWLAHEGFTYIDGSDKGAANADHHQDHQDHQDQYQHQHQHQERWNGLHPLPFDATSDWDSVVDDVGVWMDASTRPDAVDVCSASGGALGTPLWSTAAASAAAAVAGDEPGAIDSVFMRAYDAVWTLAYALNATLTNSGSADDGAAVMAALLRTDVEGIAGLPPKFDSRHVGEKILWPAVHQIAKQARDGVGDNGVGGSNGAAGAASTAPVVVARIVESSPNTFELDVDAAAWHFERVATTTTSSSSSSSDGGGDSSGGGGGGVAGGVRWLGESHGDGNMPTLDHSVFYADESFWGGGEVKYELTLRNAFGEQPRGNTTVEVCFAAKSRSDSHVSPLTLSTVDHNCNTHHWLSASKTGRIHGVLIGTTTTTNTVVDDDDTGNDAGVKYKLQANFFTSTLTDPLLSRVGAGPAMLLTQQLETQYPRRPLPSVTEGDLTLGILLDMSSSANWKAECWQNYLLAFDQVNKDPTVLPNIHLGYSLFNSKADAAAAEMHARRMLRARPDNNLVGLLGPAWTTACPGAAEAVTNAMVPMISGSSDYIKMANKGTKYSYFFRTAFSKGMSIELTAEYLKIQGWTDAIMIASWNDKGNTAVNADVPFSNDVFESRGIRRSKHYFHSKTLDKTPTGECGQPPGTYFHPGCSGDICVTTVTDTDYGRACNSTAEADVAYRDGIDATLRAARATGIRIIIFDVFSEGDDLMAHDLHEAATRVNMLDVSQYTWLSNEGTSVLLGSPWATMDGFVLIKDSEGDGGAKPDEMRLHEALWAQESTPRGAEHSNLTFDAVTGFPDYTEYSTRTSKYGKLWDTNGDGKLNDIYGKFAYDAVWVFARALDAQIKAGVTPYDGAALRARILATDFPMASGSPSTFHPVYQDRMKANNVYEVQNNGTDMTILVQQDSVGESAVLSKPMHSTPNASCKSRPDSRTLETQTNAAVSTSDDRDGDGGGGSGGGGVAQSVAGCSPIHDSAFADNFPDGILCDAADSVIDTTPFDGVVSCIPSVSITNNVIHTTTDPIDDGLIAAVVTSMLVLVLLAAALVDKKIKEKKERNKPTDFRTIFADWQSKAGKNGESIQRRLSNIDDDDYGAPREVRRSALNMVERVGSGQFGAVWKSMLDETDTGGPPSYLVAAKTVIDPKASPVATRELQSEALVMAQVTHHQHVVSLVGVITRGSPLVLIMSYCEYGSLLGLLRKRANELSPLSFRLKLTLGLHVAKGMEHLASLSFVHRDLAARNTLVATGMVGQVADFGLSRGTVLQSIDADGNQQQQYQSQAGIFPIRWTSPEAMEKLTFSTASDVWSLAIVMVELFQNGDLPYGHIERTADVMQRVMGGLMHPQPEECTDELYEFLCKCWSLEPRDRPDFTTVVATLSAAGPAVEKRKTTYKKRNSANNPYADFDFGGGSVVVDTDVETGGRVSRESAADDGIMYPIMEDHRRHASGATVTRSPGRSSSERPRVSRITVDAVRSSYSDPIPVPSISAGPQPPGGDSRGLPLATIDAGSNAVANYELASATAVVVAESSLVDDVVVVGTSRNADQAANYLASVVGAWDEGVHTLRQSSLV